MDLSGISDAILALWNSILDTIGGIDVAGMLSSITDWISAFPFF